MNKEALFQEMSRRISNGEISKEEVMRRFHLESTQQVSAITEEAKDQTHFPVNKMLYVLGGVIVVVGICIFVSQIWDNMGSFAHIIVTLGLGLVMTGSGLVLLQKKSEDIIGMVFICMGGALIPGGALVTLSEFGSGQNPEWLLAITFATVTAFYIILNTVYKNAFLTLFSIANGTAFVYLLTQAILGDNVYYSTRDDMYAYVTMVLGVSYLLLAYAFREGWNKILIGTLYFFGITGFLGATYSRVFDSGFWQILYFFIIGACLFLSVYLRKSIILVMSTLFLIAHVTYITSKYFADSLGWPIVLILLGFVFIGLGFATVAINKKYIAK